jgi:hypothetical protein
MILIMEQLDRLEYSLDQNGGPNHVGNFCFSPIHGDTRTGALTRLPIIILSFLNLKVPKN